MANLEPHRREPTRLAAGDTINFLRSFGKYPFTGGWVLKYEMRGQAQPIEFISQQWNAGNDHLLFVAAATTQTWLPGEYMLEGFAENAGTGERYQIYLAQLELSANLEGSAGDINVTTHAQRMVALIETVMEGKAGHDVLNSVVEGTRIDRIPPKELFALYVKYKVMRKSEVDAERARSGQPSRNKIRPLFSITSPGPVLGMGMFPGDNFGGPAR